MTDDRPLFTRTTFGLVADCDAAREMLAGKLCAQCGKPLTQRYSASIMRKLRFCSKPCAGKSKVQDADKRFDKKVTGEPNTGCHLWLGASGSKSAYGSFGLNGKTVRAHIYAYVRKYGPVTAGKVVAHKCDIPLCVNPDHLFEATQAENIADAMAKGRMAKGERQGNSKLTEADVLAIRSWTGKSVDAARHFGVSPVTITNIKQRARWGHVP